MDLGCPNVEGLFKLFTSCLKDVMFPGAWKKARLILLRKENKPAKSPSAGQYTCWMMSVNCWNNWWQVDYGLIWIPRGVFNGRRNQALSLILDGEVALAVVLDIAKSFNSIRGVEYSRRYENITSCRHYRELFSGQDAGVSR